MSIPNNLGVKLDTSPVNVVIGNNKADTPSVGTVFGNLLGGVALEVTGAALGNLLNGSGEVKGTNLNRPNRLKNKLQNK